MPIILSCPLKQRRSGVYEMGEYTVHYGTEALFATGEEDPIRAYVEQTLPHWQDYDWDDWGCGIINYPDAFFHWNRSRHQLSQNHQPKLLYWVGPL